MAQRKASFDIRRFRREDRLVRRDGGGKVAVVERRFGRDEPRIGRLLRLAFSICRAWLDRDRAGQAGLLRGIEHGDDELADLRLGQRALKARNQLAADHREDGRDALHLQRLRDARVGVDIDLGQDPGAAGLIGEPLEDRRELLARLAPGGPQVEQDGHLEGPIEHLGLKRIFGDLDDRGRDRAGWGGGGPGSRFVSGLYGAQVDCAGHRGESGAARLRRALRCW